MARSRKNGSAALVLASAGAKAAKTPSALEAEAAAAAAIEEALAERFLGARLHGARALVEVAVECGGILIEAREVLRGRYRAWIKERLHLERSTAENFVAMARLARGAPAVLARHRDLGVSKLYQVARLAPDSRDAILATPDVAAMNDRQFRQVVAPYRERRRKVTGAMRAHGMGERVRAFRSQLTGWRPGRIPDSDARRSLTSELKELRRAIDEVLRRVER